MVTWRNAPIKGCLHLVMMFLLKSCRIFFWVCFRKVRGMKHASKIKSSIYILSVPSFPLFDSSHNKWNDIHQMIQAAVTQTLIPKFVGLVTAKRVTFSHPTFYGFWSWESPGKIPRDHATDATRHQSTHSWQDGMDQLRNGELKAAFEQFKYAEADGVTCCCNMLAAAPKCCNW